MLALPPVSKRENSLWYWTQYANFIIFRVREWEVGGMTREWQSEDELEINVTSIYIALVEWK